MHEYCNAVYCLRIKHHGQSVGRRVVVGVCGRVSISSSSHSTRPEYKCDEMYVMKCNVMAECSG